MGIQFIVCLNKQGIQRLARWYVAVPDQSKTSQQIFKLISSRDQRHQSNFVEFQSSTKLIYKRYAGLYFVMGVDLADEELIYLSTIHLFVEVLDAYFGNVCELDIVFNFHKVYAVVDEMFVAGNIQETNKELLLDRLAYLDKLD